MKTRLKHLLLFLLLLALPALAQAQDAYSTNADGSIYTYSTNADGSANIVAYAGPPWVVSIPTHINGLTVTTIGQKAFAYTSLTSVTIPDSVTSIGAEAFDNYSLTAITVDTNNRAYSSLNGVLFDKSQTTLIQYPIDLVGSYVIPSSVTNIGVGAFEGCGLTNVIIGNSVISIGEYAFAFCSGLHRAYFQGNAPLVDGAAGSADSSVFAGESGTVSGTVFYYAGTSGWSGTYGGWPAVESFAPPQIGSSSSIQSGNFSFTITGASNQTVTIEASTDLVNWQPIWTNILSGTSTNFIDVQWKNFPMRFYQAARAHTVGGTLTGLPAGDTVTLLNGGDNLTLSTNGTFTFVTPLADGQSYSVIVSGMGGGTSILTAIYWPVATNGSGTISGANVTNVAVQCTPIYTGNLDVDMYNAAVEDGTANGGVPGVMLTQNGGPVRVNAAGPNARNSDNVAEIYSGRCVFTTVVGSTSCSSTTFPSGTRVIQFGTLVECGFGPYRY
jgi:hypothetical protein